MLKKFPIVVMEGYIQDAADMRIELVKSRRVSKYLSPSVFALVGKVHKVRRNRFSVTYQESTHDNPVCIVHKYMFV